MNIQYVNFTDDHTAAATAINDGMTLVRARLGKDAKVLLQGVTVQVGNGITDSGGEAFATERRIVLDATKSAMSLQAAEDLLISEGYYEPDDLTQLWPGRENDLWGYGVYNIVHEIGHLVPATIPPELSPTKYGRTRSNETLPEVFAYYVFGAPLSDEAMQVIKDVISSHLGAANA